MKKIFNYLLLILISALFINQNAFSDDFNQQNVTYNNEHMIVLGDNLRIRQSATTDGTIIGSLDTGTIVQVLDKTDSLVTISGKTDYWYLVTNGSANGWCFGYFLAHYENYIDDANSLNLFILRDFKPLIDRMRGNEINAKSILNIVLFNLDNDSGAELSIHYINQSNNPALMLWDYNNGNSNQYTADTFINIEDVDPRSDEHSIKNHFLDINADEQTDMMLEIHNPVHTNLIFFLPQDSGFTIAGDIKFERDTSNNQDYFFEDANYNGIPDLHIPISDPEKSTYEFCYNIHALREISLESNYPATLTPGQVITYTLMIKHSSFYYKNFYNLLCSRDREYLRTNYSIFSAQSFADNVMDNYSSEWVNFFDMSASRVLINSIEVDNNTASILLLADF